RRVKCDETKPECLRCQKFGRTCDGYAEPPPPGQEPTRSRRRLAVVPIKPRSSPVALTGPTISIHRTEEECRYFDVFVEFSARELPGYFPTDFWSRIVSQESHALTPIRYAAIAIGALNRSLEKAPESQLKVNIIQNIDKRHHEYAVLYFLRAVQSLNQYLSKSRSPQTRVALICCLLFVCFETFQGSFVSTCRQYYGGLSILRSYCARYSLPGSRNQRALPQQSLIESSSTQMESLIQMFTRLDGSGEYFGMPPLIPPMMWDIRKVYHRPIPDTFPDFPSAQRTWDFLMDEALQFYRRTFFNKVFAPANSDPPAKIAKKYTHYIQKLSTFERAFQPILNNAVESNGTIINPAALVLSLYQKCTLIILAAVQDPSEMIYDSYLPEFQYVTSTCTRLIRSQSGTQMGTHNIRFSFEVGFIPPLHFVVMKCRDPIIRREGINLLLSCQRQEGMWDSILCGRIGAWLVACEEEGLPPPPIEVPEKNRVQITVLHFHIPERYIKFKCRKALPGANGSRDEREIVLTW
ncbi:hypothetical protein OIDMADRAFT_121649, partial [Oidiodendron maius Zn]